MGGGYPIVVISFLFVYYFCSLKKILSLMMIKTLDRLNGEGLEILSEKATDCKSVEAIRCISSGSGFWAKREAYPAALDCKSVEAIRCISSGSGDYQNVFIILHNEENKNLS